MPEEHQEAPTNTPVVPASESARCRPTAQQESSEVYSANPVRTRSYEDTAEAVKELTNSSQQEAGRKAAVQNIVRQRQTQKQEKLQIEQAHFSQQVEASKRNSSTIPLPDSQAVFKPMDQTRSSTVGTAKANSFHNTVSLDKGIASKGQIPIKKKSDLPIRTKQGAVPIKTAEWASEKIVDSTAEKAFQEAQKSTITAVQKSSHAAATAGRRAVVAAKKAAELAAKLARSAAEAAKALYTAIAAGGVASVLVIVIVVLIGCGAAIFGSQDESTETLPLSAEVEAYEPVIRKYAKQYGIPDYVPLIQAVMMQESGGRGNDPMQASECGYNTQYNGQQCTQKGRLTMAVTASVHTLQDYLDQAAPVLLEIPGLSQLMQASGNSYDVLAGMYPDAAFTLMVMNNLFHHDCEFSEIHQQAFFAIIDGADIPSVRRRYDLYMDAYWQKHAWDD